MVDQGLNSITCYLLELTVSKFLKRFFNSGPCSSFLVSDFYGDDIGLGLISGFSFSTFRDKA